MADLKKVNKLGDLDLEDQKWLKQWLRFKFYTYARPAYPDLQTDLVIERQWDVSQTFLRGLMERMVASDIARYNKFLSRDKSPQEFAARRWAIINYCAKILEDEDSKHGDKLKAMTLQDRVYKELQKFYDEGGAEIGKEMNVRGDGSWPFESQEEIDKITEAIAKGERLDEPIEEDSELEDES